MFELTVILKDDERTYKQKFLSYQSCTLKPDDPYIKTCIEEARLACDIKATDITIKISMEC